MNFTIHLIATKVCQTPYTGYKQPDLIDFGVLLLVGVAPNHLFDRGWNPLETPHSWD